MSKPLILTQEQFEANQAAYAEFDQSVGMECVPQTDPISFTARIRNIIADNRRISSRGAEGMPMEEVWGPTVRSEQAMTQMFKLVPQGTASLHKSTDGTELMPAHPAAIVPPLADLLATTHGLGLPQLPSPYVGASIKLYRVVEAIEITAEEVGQDIASKKRKNAKPTIYIRGSIVEPRLRVEI